MDPCPFPSIVQGGPRGRVGWGVGGQIAPRSTPAGKCAFGQLVDPQNSVKCRRRLVLSNQ
eukprot:1141515-Pelagomonas_calceolata.AAC.11